MSVTYGDYDLFAEEVHIKTKKKYAEHHLLGINGSHLENLGTEAMVISGTGKYVGSKSLFDNLMSCVNDKVMRDVHINGIYKGTGMLTDIDITISNPQFIEFDFEIAMHTNINSISSITRKKSTTKYAYYTTTKKNQNLDKIVKNMNSKYKQNWTTKQIMSWNSIKNKKSIPKGKKLKFKYTVVQTVTTKVS